MLSSEMEQTVRRLWEAKSASSGLPTAEEVVQTRAVHDQMVDGVPLDPHATVEERSLPGLRGEFYRYDGDDKRKDCFLLYFHGGAFENGTVKTRRWASMGIAVAARVDAFSLDYTQWPEGKHPVALEEATRAFDEVLALGYEPQNVYLAGESAGATLALTLLHWLKCHDRALPGKVVAIGPVLNIAEEYPSRTANVDRDPIFKKGFNSTIRYFWEAEDLKSPYVSPRYGDFKGFPKTFVTVGTEEVLYDDAVDLHQLLDAAGVQNTLRVYEGLFHTFQMSPAPESVASIAEIGEFLRE